MKNKSESLDCFRKFHKYAELHTGTKLSFVNVIAREASVAAKLKTVRTDNGGEYISAPFKKYLADHGIHHQLTIAYTPQQNGVAERMNRTLLNMFRSMLHSKSLDKRLWAEALDAVVYIRNRVPSHSLPSDQTPHGIWIGSKPDLSHLRIFGSKCWYIVPRTKLQKLDSRARPAIMIGYAKQSKGYKLWDTELQKAVISRDVQFDEQPCQKSVDYSTLTSDSGYDVLDQGREDRQTDLEIEQESSKNSDESDSNQFVDCEETLGYETKDQEIDAQPQLRRSTRLSKKPTEWWKTTSTAFTARTVPLSYKTATSPENIDFWMPGIEREHDCLLRNNTWNLVPRKEGMNVLPSKYVFRVKNGGPKARLVLLCCRQIYSLDYSQTFAPVVKMSTIRLVLALVARMDLECEQMDVVTAFLNGDLDENIYMEIPQGLKTPENSNKVCELVKALYGLKQAPRQWYAKIHDYLVNQLGSKSSVNDPCLYTLHKSASFIIIALYVDDLLIAGNSPNEIKNLKSDLSKIFEMKDLGPLSVMLGIDVERNRERKQVFISQLSYIQDILTLFRMENSKPLNTPMIRPDKNASKTEIPEGVPYRQAIGSLMYLMIGTRPDTAYAIGKLAQKSENPKSEHWTAVKRVFRYIKGTENHGILYDGSKELRIHGFSDSDYAGCSETRKSTSGYLFQMRGGAISWRSKKQTAVATSSCEAEYIALCLATKEAIGLSRLCSDLTNKVSPDAIMIKVDNDGTIDMAKKTTINDRSKHIDTQYHFARDCVAQKKIKLGGCPSNDNLADPLTKPLERLKHATLTRQQGVCCITLSLASLKGECLN